MKNNTTLISLITICLFSTSCEKKDKFVGKWAEKSNSVCVSKLEIGKLEKEYVVKAYNDCIVKEGEKILQQFKNNEQMISAVYNETGDELVISLPNSSKKVPVTFNSSTNSITLEGKEFFREILP